MRKEQVNVLFCDHCNKFVLYEDEPKKWLKKHEAICRRNPAFVEGNELEKIKMITANDLIDEYYGKFRQQAFIMSSSEELLSQIFRDNKEVVAQLLVNCNFRFEDFHKSFRQMDVLNQEGMNHVVWKLLEESRILDTLISIASIDIRKAERILGKDDVD